MNIKIVIDEKELTNIILEKLQETLGNIDISAKDIKIEVKSKQNYKSEWESANFRAIYEKPF